MDRSIQVAELTAAGATEARIEELLRYDAHAFAGAGIDAEPLPLADEPFVDVWAGWLEEARHEGVFPVLARHLPQLAFPVRAGVRQSEAYRAATLRGVAPETLPPATGLALERPEDLELELYPSLAGRIPVLTVRWRPDFVLLVQALAKKNEPVPVPAAQGAVMVAGYNNWERIRQLEKAWESRPPAARATATWAAELARLKPHKELYQDRFILLSDGPYSAVAAADLGLGDDAWRALSLAIRREHECTHYFTRRAYGVMKNHVLDEILADYMGLVAACGRYRADWFLRFVGLDGERYRPGARLDIYRGELSGGAFRVLHELVRRAAANVERFDARWPAGPRSLDERGRALRSLASFSFLELASPSAPEWLEARSGKGETE